MESGATEQAERAEAQSQRLTSGARTEELELVAKEEEGKRRRRGRKVELGLASGNGPRARRPAGVGYKEKGVERARDPRELGRGSVTSGLRRLTIRGSWRGAEGLREGREGGRRRRRAECGRRRRVIAGAGLRLPGAAPLTQLRSAHCPRPHGCALLSSVAD